MTKYCGYPRYKSTDQQWIGLIPEHWEIKRVKYILQEINDRTKGTEDELLSVSQYTGVTRKSDSIDEGEFLTNAASLDGYKKVAVGDLVINIMLAWNGSLGVSELSGITSPAYGVYKLRTGLNPRYFHYLFKTPLYLTEFKSKSTGVIESRLRLYTDSFNKVFAIIPPEGEQNNIVDFLDRKTAEIKKFIESKERTIQLLKERKAAIINHAVTKGLNPNVELKDSGIDWPRAMPKSWKVKKLKYLVSMIGGFAFNSSEFRDEGVQLLKIANLYQNELHLDRQPTYMDRRYLKTHQQWVVSKDDILISLTGTLGKRDYGFAVLLENEDEFLLNQRVAKIQARKSVDTRFLLFLLQSELFLDQIYRKPSGTKQANLSNEDILSSVVVIPNTIDEQVEIAKYITSRLNEVDKIIDGEERQIHLADEHLKALVSESVTGKIDVRNKILIHG